MKCGKAIRGRKASRDGFGLLTVPKDFASQMRIPTPEVQLNANHVLLGAGLPWGEGLIHEPLSFCREQKQERRAACPGSGWAQARAAPAQCHAGAEELPQEDVGDMKLEKL